MQHQASMRGNALFVILIAVGLIGALLFALSKNGRGTTTVLTQEQARLNASEIVQFGNGLRPVVDRMLLLGGVSDNNASGNGILFSATGANASYGVVGAQPATEIFNAAGGNAPYMTPPSAACIGTCSYEFSGQYTVTGVGADTNPELVMLLVDIPQKVCEKINAMLNLSWASVPTGGALVLTRFNGTNYGGANAVTLTGASNEFVGKRAFCYRETGARYIFLEVLRAR